MIDNVKLIYEIMRSMSAHVVSPVNPGANDPRKLQAQYIADRLNECERIVKDLWRIENKRNELIVEYNDAFKALGVEVKEVREKCPHYVTTYYPDPSGNNDSETTCDICGKEM